MKFKTEIEELIAQYFNGIPEGNVRVQHVISEHLLREFLQVFSAKIGRDAHDIGYQKAVKGDGYEE